MTAIRPRELFGVGVRLLAVWFWTQAAYWAYWAVTKTFSPDAGNPHVSQREDISAMFFNGLLGVFLMCGARALVWLAYGDDRKPAHDADESDPTAT